MNDSRALLLNKKSNQLTSQDKVDIKNYKMVLFRLAKKSEGLEYNAAAAEHMRQTRAKNKIINKNCTKIR